MVHLDSFLSTDNYNIKANSGDIKGSFLFFIPLHKMNYALLIRLATASQPVNQRGAYKVKVIRIKHNY